GAGKVGPHRAAIPAEQAFWGRRWLRSVPRSLGRSARCGHRLLACLGPPIGVYLLCAVLHARLPPEERAAIARSWPRITYSRADPLSRDMKNSPRSDTKNSPLA